MTDRSPLAWLMTSALACGVSQEATSLERDVPFACSDDSDCPAGSCLAEFGICTRAEGKIESLLFEVTPQASDPVYGGARFLTMKSVAPASADGSPWELNVKPRVPVTGQVRAAPEQQDCLVLSQSTLPVTLTFTPRERLLGLSLPSYEIRTEFIQELDVREYVFSGSLPPGQYDVYMRPNVDALDDGCRAIPQIFRDQEIGITKENESLALEQPQPSTLRLTIAWEDGLDGWQLDMVHPVTGEVISNVVQLRASDVDASTNTLVTTLDYSHADGDFIAPGGELVRLAPPKDLTAGTVLMQRSGLEIVEPGQGRIADVSSFGKPVAFQAWVWEQFTTDAPVPGSVSFSSIELDEVGVPASFETTTVVDATGQVNASLLPGRYRVRVTPPAQEVRNLQLTGYESNVTVWAGGERQGGHVIEVPLAASLSGHIVADTDGVVPLRRVEIRASATDPNRNRCPASPDGSLPSCESALPPVLERARAQDPFIPRTRNGLSADDGRFTINGLDCGRCEPDKAPYFDLTVRPDISTGLPWMVRAAVDPIRDVKALASTPWRIGMPVARPMVVTYGKDSCALDSGDRCPSEDERVTRRLSGALVRVFAVLDGRGDLVAHPEMLPPCITRESARGADCRGSLIQVAEARTGSEGEFLLLLPPDVE